MIKVLFNSLRKSWKIKRVTKRYRSNLYPDYEKFAEDILSFITKDSQLGLHFKRGEVLKKLDTKMIVEIMKEFENRGMGSGQYVAGHCPVISCFFFPDLLFFMITAKISGAINMQLLHEVHDFFKFGGVWFKPKSVILSDKDKQNYLDHFGMEF